MSKHTGHTPGPWRVVERPRKASADGIAAFGERYTPPPGIEIETAWEHGQLQAPAPVVTIFAGPYAEPCERVWIQPADAALISAAPDLLEACRAMIRWTSTAEPGPPPTEQMRAAIAKATAPASNDQTENEHD